MSLFPVGFRGVLSGCGVHLFVFVAWEGLSSVEDGHWRMRQLSEWNEALVVLSPVSFCHCVALNVEFGPSVESTVVLASGFLGVGGSRGGVVCWIVRSVLMPFYPFECDFDGKLMYDRAYFGYEVEVRLLYPWFPL